MGQIKTSAPGFILVLLQGMNRGLALAPLGQELQTRLTELIQSAGYSYKLRDNVVSLNQVGYANRSVEMTISLLRLHGVELIEFESEISTPTAFERAALAVYEGNFRCRIVGFSAEEVSEQVGERFQVVARSHLYAGHFSDAEFLSMLKLYLIELDEIDDEITHIVDDGRLPNG